MTRARAGRARGERRALACGGMGRARRLGRSGGVARSRAERVACGLGRPGREREEWAWAAGLGWGFVFLSFSISILFLFSISNSNKV